MEMQVLIPKATEVSKVHQSDTQKGTLQQQEFAMELQKNMLVRQRQVQTMSETEGRKVDKDKEKENRKNNKKDEDEEEQEKKEKKQALNLDPLSRGSILDINT
jgi:uncharacterized protein with WD repeat